MNCLMRNGSSSWRSTGLPSCAGGGGLTMRHRTHVYAPFSDVLIRGRIDVAFDQPEAGFRHASPTPLMNASCQIDTYIVVIQQPLHLRQQCGALAMVQFDRRCGNSSSISG